MKDGWPKLRDFLGLETTSDQFPHENKGKNADDFVMSLFAESKYRKFSNNFHIKNFQRKTVFRKNKGMIMSQI